MITEKVDGTNAQILVEDGCIMGVGSRKRWITPDKDNFGFAQWCADNHLELARILGDGRHYGEWAGPGIQKNRHELPERRFYHFKPWEWPEERDRGGLVHVVPVLFEGYAEDFTSGLLDSELDCLDEHGSFVLNGWTEEGGKPAGTAEGIVVHAFGIVFKHTLEGPKWRDK
jgi:hypothetical protein